MIDIAFRAEYGSDLGKQECFKPFIGAEYTPGI